MKGSCDPILDKMNEAEKKQLEHLNMLERKGFDVKNLRKQLIDENVKFQD